MEHLVEIIRFFLRAQDIYEGNTSQSHEFGHGLGLPHVASGYIPGQPSIMSTINNTVDPKYSIDGETINTLDRIKRRVTQLDLNQMHLGTYKYGERSRTKYDMFGSSSNILFDAAGNTIGGKPTTKSTED